MTAWKRALQVWARRARECRHPVLLASAVRHGMLRLRLLEFATGQPRDVLGGYIREIEDDEAFLQPFRAALARATTYTPRAGDFMMTGESGSVLFNEVALYALVRARRPLVVVETGGTPGKSSAFILQAMMRNGTGHLFTVDLPPPESATSRIPRERYHDVRPAGTGSNWVVPAPLRGRQTLRIGPSHQVLPPLLASLDAVDLFLHDSDHSYAHMYWEFETAWPRVGPTGLLVSDDVLANDAFADFCRKESLASRTVFNLGVARRRPQRPGR
jgi:predicted O-methyltransferase YrrM